MMGFKAFHSVQATLSGIELHHMLRKNQHHQSDSMTIFEQFYGLAASARPVRKFLRQNHNSYTHAKRDSKHMCFESM